VINIPAPINDAECLHTVRATRWAHGVMCPGCDGAEVTQDGDDNSQTGRDRLRCRG
jgi:hypothetical protein